ncbi:MAG: hypothetical protein KKD28_12715 [Chloroflexi bacterium]|nr:hypothetical protein [Chloroflexota bacterium]MBU1662321.1 hypothetical protein [Chloroflexota bacterium]
MWKKALWIYIGLYCLGVLYIIGSGLIEDFQNGSFNLISLPFPLLMFLPAVAIALGLRGKKVPIILILFGLLIAAFPVIGIFNFDGFTLITIGKALLFVPLLAGLIYFGNQRVRGKTS